MAWTIDRRDFEARLAILEVVGASAPSTMPAIFGHARLAFAGNKLVLEAFNSMIGYRSRMTCTHVSGKPEGERIIPAVLLAHAVKSARASVKKISVEFKDENAVIVRDGSGSAGFSANFMTVPVENYTPLPQPEEMAPLVWQGPLTSLVVPLVTLRRLARQAKAPGVVWGGDDD